MSRYTRKNVDIMCILYAMILFTSFYLISCQSIKSDPVNNDSKYMRKERNNTDNIWDDRLDSVNESIYKTMNFNIVYDKYTSLEYNKRIIWKLDEVDNIVRVNTFGKRIFTINRNNILKCICISDGSIIWTKNDVLLIYEVDSDRSIILDSVTGSISLLRNYDGSTIWSIDANIACIYNMPFIAQASDKRINVLADNKLIIINILDGVVVNVVNINNEIIPAMKIIGDLCCFCYRSSIDGNIYIKCIDMSSYKVYWSREVGKSSYNRYGCEINIITPIPIITVRGDNIHVICGQDICVINMHTGNIVWTGASNSTENICIGSAKVYINSYNGNIKCINALTNEPQWTVNLSGYIYDYCISQSQRLYIASRRQEKDYHKIYLSCISGNNGIMEWELYAEMKSKNNEENVYKSTNAVKLHIIEDINIENIVIHAASMLWFISCDHTAVTAK